MTDDKAKALDTVQHRKEALDPVPDRSVVVGDTAPQPKSRWDRLKRSGTQLKERGARFVGRGLKMAGDGVRARYGEHGSDLQASLHELGDEVGGEPNEATHVETLLLQDDPRWWDFNTRATVAQDLADKVLEIMQPSGWALVMNVASDRARELLEIIDRELPQRTSWRAILTDCKGHFHDLCQAAEELSHQDKSEDKQKIEADRRRAKWALESLVKSLKLLVRARDDYATGRAMREE